MADREGRRERVVIAGGGLAGLEAALALRALAPGRLDVVVLDPRARFSVPATAAGRAFGVGWSIDRSMATVVAAAGARVRRARLVAVDGRRRIAMLAGGELMPYDHLIVAVGGRPVVTLPDALTFRGHGDAAELRALVDGVAEHAARGARTDLAVVVPGRCAWPLTAYEVALMTREHLAGLGLADRCVITVLTAEQSPLAAFGESVGDTVAHTLARAGVQVRAGVEVEGFVWGRLIVAGGGARRADRVVALPALAGPGIEGLPTDAHDFVECDPAGLVAGAPGVRVVGDAGAAPVREGGRACRQADAAAAAIARALDGDGGTDAGAPAEEEPLSWPVARVSGRFLTPFLDELSQSAAGAAA